MLLSLPLFRRPHFWPERFPYWTCLIPNKPNRKKHPTADISRQSCKWSSSYSPSSCSGLLSKPRSSFYLLSSDQTSSLNWSMFFWRPFHCVGDLFKRERGASHLVRFPDPPYGVVVTFKSVGEPDYIPPQLKIWVWDSCDPKKVLRWTIPSTKVWTVKKN